MKNPLVRMKEMYHSIGESERAIAEYLLESPKVVLELSIRELATRLFVSPATIVRFCKRLGFEGYRDFRQMLIYELAMYAKNDDQGNIDISRNDSIEQIIQKIINQNILSLQETGMLMDEKTMESCVDLIQNTNNILLFGIGASQSVAKDAYLKFLRISKPCAVVEDWHAQLLMAKNSTTRDLGIIISYSGETVEMVECMRALTENRTPTIAITRFAPSTISSMATKVLYVSATESVFRSGALSSRIAQLNIIDILYTAYASRNYDESIKHMKNNYIRKPNI